MIKMKPETHLQAFEEKMKRLTAELSDQIKIPATASGGVFLML